MPDNVSHDFGIVPEEESHQLIIPHVPWYRSLPFKMAVAFGVMTIVAVALTTYAAIEAYRLVLSPLISAEDINAAESQIYALLFVVIPAVSLGTLLFAMLISSFVLRPVRELMQGLRRVATDDLSVASSIHSSDELGGLAVLFNSMVTSLREVRARDEAMSRLKSQFVSVAAHQLRTPLTTMKWSIRALLDEAKGSLNNDQRHTLEQEYEVTGEMITLVNELLNVSRLEDGKYTYLLRSIDISSLITETVAHFRLAARAHHIRVTVDVSEIEGVRAFGDRALVKLALTNLLDNAMRYTREGGWVTVRAEYDDNWATISVADNGIGIPDVDKDKVLEKFYRARNAQRIQTDGSGLGLYLVQSIVTRHGGRLWFDSTEGEGSTFYITLPLKRSLIPEQKLRSLIGEL